MRRTKWLFVFFTVGLCALAAGIGIGLALPRFGEHRDGSEFFRRLEDETAPAESFGGVFQTGLSIRLFKKFKAWPFLVLRSKTERFPDIGTNNMAAEFRVIIMATDSFNIDSQAFLNDMEVYLKEVADAAQPNEIGTTDFEKDGKKVAFQFHYRTPNGECKINVKLYKAQEWTDPQGVNRASVAVSMDVWESL